MQFFRTKPGKTGLFIFLFFCLFAGKMFAHPMQYSLLWLDIQPNAVYAELQLPMSELELAMGKKLPVLGPLSPEMEKDFSTYLLTHIRVVSPDGAPWDIKVDRMGTGESAPDGGSVHKELVADLWFQPPPGESSRNFILYYDAIVHEINIHKVWVSIRQDWEAGKMENVDTQVGVIERDAEGTIQPLSINLEKGSITKGFTGAVRMGFQHISEGADHLLFIFLLLLPAPLIAAQQRWKKTGSTKQNILKLLKIVTAFTLGHSCTLILAALNWIRLPSQPVEICIGITIFITAIHVLRPVFPKKEMWVAAFFGLIHGLAFATVLSNLHLEPRELMLSILGFNLGIELMQIFFVLITLPWLLILSRYKAYTWLRVGGACLAMIAALGWILERFLSTPNIISTLADRWILQYPWFVFILAIGTLLIYIIHRIAGKKQEKGA